MVLPLIDEDRRRQSMIRCPRFEGCDSPLCPLDPYLQQKVHVPGKPLCLWYRYWLKTRKLNEIPRVVRSELPIYSVYVALHTPTIPDEAKISSPGSRR